MFTAKQRGPRIYRSRIHSKHPAAREGVTFPWTRTRDGRINPFNFRTNADLRVRKGGKLGQVKWVWHFFCLNWIKSIWFGVCRNCWWSGDSKIRVLYWRYQSSFALLLPILLSLMVLLNTVGKQKEQCTLQLFVQLNCR